MEKTDNIKVIGAGLIDAALTIVFFVLLFRLVPANILNKVQAKIDPNLCIVIGFILYRFVTILLFDSTLGMKVFKLIFLNGEEEALTLKEKTLASVFILYQGVEYYKRG
jgi:hypothetical protein